MRCGLSVATIAALSLFALHAHAEDCHVTEAFSVGGKKVFNIGDGALAFASGFAVDMDGAPNAYHRLGRVEGKALDTLCNAGRAWPGDGRPPYHGSAKGRCGEFLQDVAAAEAAGWTGPTTIEWYGLATKDKKLRVPYVQQSGPTKGFYVSTTALQDPENFPDAGDVRRYLDARTVPFIVVPKGSPFIRKGEAGLRDLVVSYNPRNHKVSYGVVGDLGPADMLGEVSIAYANALREGAGPMPVDRMTHETVGGLAISQPVVTVVFRGVRLEPPYTPEAVVSAARTQFDQWGGKQRINACAKSLGVS